MTKKPTVGETLAREIAAAVAKPPEEAPPPKSRGGRPPGRRREVANRLTVHLDAGRDKALKRMAVDQERSVHSLVIEAIDKLIGRSRSKTWWTEE